MSWTEDEKKTRNSIRRWGWWIMGTIIVLGIIFTIIGKAFGFFHKVVDPDKAVSTYENFYQMHEQCEQICSDIYIMQSADSISGGFTKNERIMGLENKLNNVIRDYNAQSQAWTRSMWKADDLPHKLKRSDFNCN